MAAAPCSTLRDKSVTWVSVPTDAASSETTGLQVSKALVSALELLGKTATESAPKAALGDWESEAALDTSAAALIAVPPLASLEEARLVLSAFGGSLRELSSATADTIFENTSVSRAVAEGLAKLFAA